VELLLSRELADPSRPEILPNSELDDEDEEAAANPQPRVKQDAPLGSTGNHRLPLPSPYA
jgi:hypothetical protein